MRRHRTVMASFRSLLFLTLLSTTLAAVVNRTTNSYSNDDIWCLLIAGSSTWMNYRHQADIAHAYQLLKRNGVAEERIVVMMYDDIAYNEENPYPGKLFNRPNGPNVYEGLKIDYKGDDVTAENFLSVMRGDAEAVKGKGTGRVIASSSSSNVFVYYADHGGVDILGMPAGPLLTANQLTSTLKKIKQAEKFHRLVMYIEACESGSMLAHMGDGIEVYGVTASNPSESSWAAYCDGWGGLPCLGDAFSVSWMEDTDTHDPSHFTLSSQFRDVKSLVSSSHVMQYGTRHWVDDAIAEFQGTRARTSDASSEFDGPSSSTAMSSLLSRVQDIPILHYTQKIERTEEGEGKERVRAEMKEIMEKRAVLHALMHSLVSSLVPVEQVDAVLEQKTGTNKAFSVCHERAIRFLDERMPFSQNPRLFHYSSTLMNLCASGHSADDVIQAIQNTFTGVEMTRVE